MPNRIADYLKPNPRFARSINIERDFRDPHALDDYFVTNRIEQLLERVSMAFAKDSTERAWRITGDYGTGKSCFALALAHICSSAAKDLPKPLKPFAKPMAKRKVFPVLVSGSREPISKAIIRSLVEALHYAGASSKLRIFGKAKKALNGVSSAERDRLAVDLLQEASAYVEGSGRGKGILLVLDELGKGLEYATQNPDQQDIFFLQTLAETASRSSKTPIVVFGILHQAFSAYADQMNPNDQREWDKIGGRFEELLFNQPLEQLIPLVSSALRVDAKRLPANMRKQAKQHMKKAIDLGWFGAVANPKTLIDQAPSIYPLHPTILPVLVRFFSRFGQNERSLFSFLNSSEPCGLRAFAEENIIKNGFYGIQHLFGFARSSLGHRLTTRNLNSRWNQVESVVEAGLSGSESEVAVLKTVGLLNMLDSQAMVPTLEGIQLALSDQCLSTKPSIKSVVDRLSNKRKVLYQRGAKGGYCLWPHTSVNIEMQYLEAEKRVGSVRDVVEAVASNLQERPIVARRHYIETGNLRYFEVSYVRSDQLNACIKKWKPAKADGVIFVPLCRTKTDRQKVVAGISKLGIRNRPEIMIAVPESVSGFAGFVNEIRKWEWVQTNTAELNGDRFAMQEVSRQITAAKTVLKDRTNHLLNVRHFRDGQSIAWFHKGKPLRKLESAKALFTHVSKICDSLFSDSTCLTNELLNRRKLSSAAAGARSRLIGHVLENATLPFLGMDPSKKPPEMSMYLSALKASNVHFEGKSGWRIQLPSSKNDTCNFKPAFDLLRQILQSKSGGRVKLSDLFSELSRPPVGAREGVLPLLLAVFCVAESQHVAMYEEGAFVQDIDGPLFERLAKVPELFEMQYCKLSGVRSEVFNKLLKVVDTKVDDSREPDLIDVVQPLVQFAATLPEYTRNTTKLSKSSLAIRDALMNAEEPATLLFKELPKACGVPAVPASKRMDPKLVQKYVRGLKKSLGEIRGCFPSLLSRIEKSLSKEFGLKIEGEKLRAKLTQRGRDLAIHVSEASLKAFALRLSDDRLPQDKWLESLGSLVAAKPPIRWYDQDELKFNQALIELVLRFKDTASLVYPKGASSTSESIRLSLLQSSGIERSCVLEIPDKQRAAAEVLEKDLKKIFKQNKKLALAVTAKLLLSQIKDGA